jgi:polyphosphate kinase
MPRNLDRRIEVAAPVFDREIQNEIREMLQIQLRDNTKARILDSSLLNQYDRSDPVHKYRAQEDFYNYIKNQHHIVMKIYHNPRCAHSRAGLKYIEKKGFDLEVIKYLTDGITKEELIQIVEKTGLKPHELVRKQEPLYKSDYKGKNMTDEEWMDVLVLNPQLLQRPVIVNGEKAVIAYPPEEVEKIL